MTVGPNKSQRGFSDSRFKFILLTSSLSLFFFVTSHVILIYYILNQPDFTTTNNNFNSHFQWLSPHKTQAERETDQRFLLECIGILLFSGFTSFSLLIASKYSNLESDRSKFQIYNKMKKEYDDFRAADDVDDSDIIDYLVREDNIDSKMNKHGIALFNILFNKGKNEEFHYDPLLNVDINQQCSDTGKTALSIAIEERNPQYVKTIIGHENTDVNKLGPLTPLHTAVKSGSTKIVELLLNHPSIDVNRDSEKMTPLTEAIRIRKQKVVYLLLKHRKIDLNKTNRNGWTPLTLAANLGEVDDMIDCCFLFRKDEKDPILQMLLQESIDTNKMDTNGKLPSALAEKNKLVFMPDQDYDYENVDEIKEEEEEVNQVKLIVRL